MFELPSGKKKIRQRIKRYERLLEKEKIEFGRYTDGFGKRYLLGPMYLLMADLEGAMNHFEWFAEEFPDDSADPSHRLAWSLALYRDGRLKEAVQQLLEAMLAHLYIIPMQLEQELPEHSETPFDNTILLLEVDDVFPETLAMWTEDEKAWARCVYESELFNLIRSRYVEIEIILENEPRGPRRSELVKELYALPETPIGGIEGMLDET